MYYVAFKRIGIFWIDHMQRVIVSLWGILPAVISLHEFFLGQFLCGVSKRMFYVMLVMIRDYKKL
jgi:hypothetical protein